MVTDRVKLEDASWLKEGNAASGIGLWFFVGVNLREREGRN